MEIEERLAAATSSLECLTPQEYPICPDHLKTCCFCGLLLWWSGAATEGCLGHVPRLAENIDPTPENKSYNTPTRK